MEVIDATTPKARIVHTCGLCYCDIAIGETYERQCLVDDDRLWTWKAHTRCSVLASAWIDVYDYDDRGVEEGSYQQVVEEMCEHYGCDLAGLDEKLKAMESKT